MSYGYDLAGRRTSLSDNSSAIAAAVPPSGTSAQYATAAAYDALDRPAGISWTPAPSAAAPSASSVAFTHTYDKTNRRIGQTVTDNSWFNYPAAAPGTVSYTADALNRYTAVGAVSPTYDGITVTVHSIDSSHLCGHHAAWPVSPVSSSPVIRTT